MNDYPIELLLQDMREVSLKASESKESALKFLMNAGIIRKKKSRKTTLAEAPFIPKPNNVNDYPIQLLLQDMREVSLKALESKESALKFLQDAGLVKTRKAKSPVRTPGK